MIRALKRTTVTVAAGGTATVYVESVISGKVHAIKYECGNLAATVNFAITGEDTGLPLLTIATVAQADTVWHPRILANKHTDGAAFTDTAGESPRVFKERIKIAVTGGGNATTGYLTFYVEDEVSM